MKNEDICWARVDREDLLDVLLGEIKPSDYGLRFQPGAGLDGNKVMVGFKDSPSGFGYSSPLLFVLPDASATETLSWIRTFAGEISPLSQYGRVVVGSEWGKFQAQSNTLFGDAKRSDLWASVIVGEALSQMESETNLLSMPLSRFAGCFTTPIARASLVWGSDVATRVCADRLRLLEIDTRFARRPVTVRQLLPVWSMVAARSSGYLHPWEAVLLVLEVGSDHLKISNAKSVALLASILSGEYAKLFSSDSVEVRVGAFNQLIEETHYLALSAQEAGGVAAASLVLAAAAFMVGRSTSHVFLLQRAQRFAPMAAAWFGVMAALAGPRAWDKAWLKAVKGAERLLWPEFGWLEAPSADISWVEFAWLAKNFKGIEVFLDLPKMLPRTLSIEIVPGASCQFRLESESTLIESQKVHELSGREYELQAALRQFIDLANNQSGLLLGESYGQPRRTQQSSGSKGTTAKPRTQRAKKTKSDTGSP